MIDKELAQSLLQEVRDLRNARIFQGNTQKPFKVQKIVLDLSTAKLETNPYKVSFPFQSLYVQEATDSATVIKFKPGTQDSYQSDFNMRSNDSWSSEVPTTEATFFWDAQSNKSITLVFFVDAEFRSGRQISVQSGGVSISEGDVIGTATTTTLAPTTATIIAPSNSNRKCSTIENNTGADLFVSGSSTVTNSGATRGLRVAPGENIKLRNTGALYGYSVLGGDTVRIEER